MLMTRHTSQCNPYHIPPLHQTRHTWWCGDHLFSPCGYLHVLIIYSETSIKQTPSQTCQLSRFCRESHDFLSFLTVSRQGSSISRVLGKIILKWFKLLNQNKNGKLTRNVPVSALMAPCLTFWPWSWLIQKKWHLAISFVLVMTY